MAHTNDNEELQERYMSDILGIGGDSINEDKRLTRKVKLTLKNEYIPPYAKKLKREWSSTFDNLVDTAKRLTESRDGYYMVVLYYEKTRNKDTVTADDIPDEFIGTGEDLDGKYWRVPRMEVMELEEAFDLSGNQPIARYDGLIVLFRPSME